MLLCSSCWNYSMTVHFSFTVSNQAFVSLSSLCVYIQFTKSLLTFLKKKTKQKYYINLKVVLTMQFACLFSSLRICCKNHCPVFIKNWWIRIIKTKFENMVKTFSVNLHNPCKLKLPFETSWIIIYIIKRGWSPNLGLNIWACLITTLIRIYYSIG